MNRDDFQSRRRPLGESVGTEMTGTDTPRPQGGGLHLRMLRESRGTVVTMTLETNGGDLLEVEGEVLFRDGNYGIESEDGYYSLNDYAIVGFGTIEESLERMDLPPSKPLSS